MAKLTLKGDIKKTRRIITGAKSHVEAAQLYVAKLSKEGYFKGIKTPCRVTVLIEASYHTAQVILDVKETVSLVSTPVPTPRGR